MSQDSRTNWFNTRRNRRTFVGGASATGLGLAALGLVGCGDDDDDNGGNETPSGNGTPAASPTSADKPKTGGTLKGAQTADLNMSTGYPFVGLAENPYINMIPVESVIQYRDTLEPELLLAERFEFNNDRSGVVVTLKPGLEFHNGAPVTADDFVFGIKLIQDPKSFGITGSFQTAAFAKAITKINVVSKTEVEMTFDQPRVNMADFFTQLKVVQQATYEDTKNGKAINGTGPYIFKQWTPGQTLTFEKNPNWHASDKLGGPYMDGIEVKFFGDQDAMGLAYQAGELDHVFNPLASLARQYEDLVSLTPKTGLTYMGMNVTNPEMTDARVRKAIFMAIDRERVVKELNEGFGTVTAQPWPKSSPAFDPALEGALYDPAGAKKLLSEAGFKQTAPIPFDHRTTQDYVNLASLIQQNLKDVGIEVKLIPSDPTAFLAILRAREFKGLWTTTHSFSNMAPLTNFQQTFPYQQPNMSYYDPPAYLDVVKQLTNLDPLSEAAKAQYKRFNDMWLNDPFLVPLAPNENPQLVSKRVRGYGSYLTSPANQVAFEKVWLDS
ncbi:MAG: ABC transporter substrate-binding protein [Dehalococcoidia bacterium]